MDIAGIRGELLATSRGAATNPDSRRVAMARAAQTTAAPSEASGAGAPAGGELGKDEFLRLLITELRCQTVTDPTDQKEFIAQMAQFSALEQMQNLNQAFTGLMHMQLATQACSLIGHKIEAAIDNQGKVTGIVSAVTFQNGVPMLQVDGHSIALSQVTSILPA
ncbi:MAG: flagellar hook assembly protein FlgD [Firmicutes bacterium]|nr:flagellar hook assembly protein FlgD [Bacillota bacterium]